MKTVSWQCTTEISSEQKCYKRNSSPRQVKKFFHLWSRTNEVLVSGTEYMRRFSFWKVISLISSPSNGQWPMWESKFIFDVLQSRHLRHFNIMKMCLREQKVSDKEWFIVILFFWTLSIVSGTSVGFRYKCERNVTDMTVHRNVGFYSLRFHSTYYSKYVFKT